MALPKIKDARSLNDTELAEEIVKAKRELFDLRLQKATRRLEKTHQFKHLRHRIAQLLTVEREREMKAEKAAVATETATVAAPENTQEAASAEATVATASPESETVAALQSETTQEAASEEE